MDLAKLESAVHHSSFGLAFAAMFKKVTDTVAPVVVINIRNIDDCPVVLKTLLEFQQNVCLHVATCLFVSCEKCLAERYTRLLKSRGE